MKAPARLQNLLAEGLIDSVVRQLKSGKEADVYVVRCGEETCAAKIYKEANNRSFRQAVDYTENRKVRNSRQARAMAKRTTYGRQQQEAAWQSAEVDALYRLAAAGVRVPRPINFHDGVLLMELVTDERGDAAPRLNDLSFTDAQARQHHATLLKEVVRMLWFGGTLKSTTPIARSTDTFPANHTSSIRLATLLALATAAGIRPVLRGRGAASPASINHVPGSGEWAAKAVGMTVLLSCAGWAGGL
jgi:hypothetical protein